MASSATLLTWPVNADLLAYSTFHKYAFKASAMHTGK
jgi:hypothetical protein